MKLKYELKYFTTKEAAIQWKVTPRTVAKYCRKGLLPKAFKRSNVWYIPENSIKPLSKREIDNAIIMIFKFYNEMGLEEGKLSDEVQKHLPEIYPALVYLEQLGYIHQVKDIDKDIDIRNILITDKGYQTIGKKIEIIIEVPEMIELITSIIKAISVLRS